MSALHHLVLTPLPSLLAVVAVQLLTAAALLSLHRLEQALQRAMPYVISLAVGVLLATGAAHLLPDSVEALGNRPALWLTLVLTMLALHAIERLFRLLSGVRAEPLTADPHAPEPDAHCLHLHGHHDHHHHASRPLTLLVGSFLHSLVDGTSIAAAFSLNARIGWITALAVALHEVPHRLGDFALLLHMGLTRARATLLAIAAGASGLLGWAAVAILGNHSTHAVAWLLPVSAGSFLYISLVDLLPELQAGQRAAEVLGQLLALATGIALAIGLTYLPGA